MGRNHLLAGVVSAALLAFGLTIVPAAPAAAKSAAFKGKPSISNVKVHVYKNVDDKVLMKFKLNPATLKNRPLVQRSHRARVSVNVKKRGGNHGTVASFSKVFALPDYRAKMSIPLRMVLPAKAAKAVRDERSPMSATVKISESARLAKTSKTARVAATSEPAPEPVNTSTEIDRWAPTEVEFMTIQLPGFQSPSNYEGSYYLVYFSQTDQGINFLQSVYFNGLYCWQVGLNSANQPSSGFVTDAGTFSGYGPLGFTAGDDGGNQGPYTGQFNAAATYLAMNTPSISGQAQNGPFGVTPMSVALYAQN